MAPRAIIASMEFEMIVIVQDEMFHCRSKPNINGLGNCDFYHDILQNFHQQGRSFSQLSAPYGRTCNNGDSCDDRKVQVDKHAYVCNPKLVFGTETATRCQVAFPNLPLPCSLTEQTDIPATSWSALTRPNCPMIR